MALSTVVQLPAGLIAGPVATDRHPLTPDQQRHRGHKRRQRQHRQQVIPHQKPPSPARIDTSHRTTTPGSPSRSNAIAKRTAATSAITAAPSALACNGSSPATASRPSNDRHEHVGGRRCGTSRRTGIVRESDSGIDPMAVPVRATHRPTPPRTTWRAPAYSSSAPVGMRLASFAHEAFR